MTGRERIFIIGDIHGCLTALKRLLDRIDWSPEMDRLIFLGDYIDRGKDSRGVIDLILDMKRESRSIECLMGNHEKVFLDYLEGRDYSTFFLNGGSATLNSYGLGHAMGSGDPLISDKHLSFLSSLQNWIELEEYFVVHAGFRPGVEIKRQNLEDILWIRETFIFSEYDFGKKVIFGHTPFHEPLIMTNKIGLDTGAVYGNKLTCLELPSFQFHSVEA